MRIGGFVMLALAASPLLEKFVLSFWLDLETARSLPYEAEVRLIHDALHTLGLGENPPTSWEINQRLRKPTMGVGDAGGA